MKTKKEVMKLLKKGIREHLFDSIIVNDIIKKIEDLNDNVTLEEISKLFDSKLAYKWARYIGDRDIMINKITNSEYAYWWGRYIGDRNIMRDRVVEDKWMFYWALDIGDREIMKKRIVEPYWIELWNDTFPDDPIAILL